MKSGVLRNIGEYRCCNKLIIVFDICAKSSPLYVVLSGDWGTPQQAKVIFRILSKRQGVYTDALLANLVRKYFFILNNHRRIDLLIWFIVISYIDSYDAFQWPVLWSKTVDMQN